MTMIVDKGMNDRWHRPRQLRRRRDGSYALTITEPLGQNWGREIVFYDLPAALRNGAQVTLDGVAVPSQLTGSSIGIRVDDLQAHEKRTYLLTARRRRRPDKSGCHFETTTQHAVLGNDLISLKLPVSQDRPRSLPGPILAVRRKRGRWLGKGSLQTSATVRRITTRLVEDGPLWATAEVRYDFAGGAAYTMHCQLRPGEDLCEITEDSSLPVRLWPAPRPYREIGTLGKSFWDQPLADLAKPCTRPCPSSNFIFDVRAGFAADRVVTHSTSAWEIMDLPLRSPTLKTYTAMRASYPAIDGGWLGVYDRRRDELVGVASVDIAHWRLPDDTVHPAHRTAGACAEVLLIDDQSGTHFRFPIENMTRRWLMAAPSRAHAAGLIAGAGDQPERLDPDPASPLWAARIRRGDLRLDKVKDWVTAWADPGTAHPRVLCRRQDFPEIAEKMRSVPEFRRNHEKFRPYRAADEYILSGKGTTLATVEAQTGAARLVAETLRLGYTGPSYAIGFARPLRRYAIACDVLWDGFSDAEKAEARRVCALAAYILTDGDWWQFALRPGETCYLPNFNTDVFACAGIIGMFLTDHPCADVWTAGSLERMEVELTHHLREDGCGEENVGAYYFSTWMQLYMPLLWAFRHCGIKDFSTDARVLGGARYTLKVLGPEDRRDQRRRGVPPIGHHPHMRKTFPIYDWLSAFVRDADPELAAQLKWAWRACGSPVTNLYDHSGPKANPLTRQYIFHDPRIAPVAPALGSYELPHVGAVLRSHDGGCKGSYLFLKAGRVHSHHDDDEGSFHYFGRGVPLALDGLPIQNGATAAQHNAVTFARPGQPTAYVEKLASTTVADYVRARVSPRGFCGDPMYIDGSHRSGWERQLVLVKAERPGDVEYLVVNDACCGPDACQWNLDVLSLQPRQLAENHVWFPGHPQFRMGLDVIFIEPTTCRTTFEAGTVNPDLLSPERRRQRTPQEVSWGIVEHWLLHLPAAAGTTFTALLFPRRPDEQPPTVTWLDREETMRIDHAAGHDLIFLRSNPIVGTSTDGVRFRGRAGVVRERRGRCQTALLDGAMMQTNDDEQLYRVY